MNNNYFEVSLSGACIAFKYYALGTPHSNTVPFRWLQDGGSARSEVLKHGDSLLHLALKCLCVVESDDGRLIEPAVRVPAVYLE